MNNTLYFFVEKLELTKHEMSTHSNKKCVCHSFTRDIFIFFLLTQLTTKINKRKQVPGNNFSYVLR